MCKRLIFLISFVLVLGLGSNALAEDLSIPYWAGGERSACAVWNFNDDGLSDWGNNPELGHPDLYEGPDPDFIATHAAMVQQDYTWYDQYKGRQGVWVTVGDWAGDLLGNMGNYEQPDIDCTKKKFRFQVTYYPIVGAGLVEPQIGPNGWVLRPDDGWSTNIVPLGDGWFHATMEVTIDSWTYEEEWWELMGANHAIDQVIIDTVCYCGDEPLPGTGARLWFVGAFNPRPADGEKRVSPDNLKLIWDPDPRSAQETVYFSHIENDVTNRSEDANQGVQDANYYPMSVYLDVDLGVTYYWLIKEVNVPIVFDACSPVWRFTIKTTAAGAPSPEVDETTGPCPTLEWDPGYGAVTHKVFFDVNFNDVNDRAFDPCYEGGNTYYAPQGPLEGDAEYFWCVDEVNASDVTAPGEVWSFTIGPDPDTDAPDWRGTEDSFDVNWGFSTDWGDGMPVWDSCSINPANPDFDPCCVDEPNNYEASYTPAGGSARTGIADMNEDGTGSLRLKHPDYATRGQYVKIRVAIIWSGEDSPGLTIARISYWGDGPLQPGDTGYSPTKATEWLANWEALGGRKNREKDPEPIYEFKLCDGWIYSVYEVTFEAVAEDADNIHVFIETAGDFYLDRVQVDAHWWTSLFAAGPTPLDEAEDVAIGTCLEWYAGLYAVEHDIYFGKSWEEVNEMTDPCWTTLLGTETYCPELDVATEYFWRITEVNDACDDSPWIGPIWSFTTAEYVVIDDFDDYTGTDSGDNQLVIMYIGSPGTWEDYHTLGGGEGEGCQVKLAGDPEPNTSPPYSMRCSYFLDKVGPYETRRTYADDGLLDGSEPFKALVLWFYGVTVKKAVGVWTPIGEIYVTLKDSAAAGGDEATVHYGNVSCVYEGAGDACDLIAKEYLKWGIPLSAFEAGGVDLDQIKSIAIGASGGGERGTIYFDDLRLYGRACHPEYSWRYGDFTGPEGVPDCAVDGEDLGVMGDAWLEADSEVLVAAPCDVNLMVEYLFDPCDLPGTKNDNLYDSSGNEHHGIDINGVTVAGGILTLGAGAPAVADWVEVGGDFNSINPFRGAIKGGGDFSIAISFRTAEPSILFSSCPYDPDVNEANGHPNDTDPSFHAMALYILPGEETIVKYDNWYITGSEVAGTPMDNQWHLVVTTYDADTDAHVTYLDGVASEPDFFDPNLNMPTTHKILIGGTQHPLSPYDEGSVDMVGDINSVQIYNYVLTYGQVLGLLDPDEIGSMHYLPLDLPPNLYLKVGDEGFYNPDNLDIVNFKDFAVLSDNWLMEAFWP